MAHVLAGKGYEFLGHTDQHTATEVMRANAVGVRLVNVGLIPNPHGPWTHGHIGGEQAPQGEPIVQRSQSDYTGTMAKSKDLVVGLPVVRGEEDTDQWQVGLPADSHRIAPATQVETVEDSRREPQIAFHVQHRRVIAALRAIGRAQEIAPRTADEQSQTVHTGLQTSVQAVAVVNEGRVTT